jgi:hypothetical protein
LDQLEIQRTQRQFRLTDVAFDDLKIAVASAAELRSPRNLSSARDTSDGCTSR